LAECLAALGADFFVMRAGRPVLIPAPAAAALTAAHLKREVCHESFAAVEADFFHKGLSIFVLLLQVMVLAAAFIAAKQLPAMTMRIVYDRDPALQTI